MAQILECDACRADIGTRLDAFVATAFSLSRSAAERLIAEGVVTVAKGEANKKYRLRGDEHVTVTLPDPVPAEAQPENIPLLHRKTRLLDVRNIWQGGGRV